MKSAPRIAIIDYKIGNLFSVQQACLHADLDPVLVDHMVKLESFDGIILPGVGAFSEAMANLESSGLDHEVKSFAKSGKPLLGICLGMQLLLSESEEFGSHLGLGLIAGQAKRFPTDLRGKVPHIGWNKVQLAQGEHPPSKLFENVPDNSYFYFVHSYYASLRKPLSNGLGQTKYCDLPFYSAMSSDNVYGVQFHPEKSGEIGLQVYKNFRDLTIGVK